MIYFLINFYYYIDLFIEYLNLFLLFQNYFNFMFYSLVNLFIINHILKNSHDFFCFN